MKDEYFQKKKKKNKTKSFYEYEGPRKIIMVLEDD